jgi:aspartyl protease family protein
MRQLVVFAFGIVAALLLVGQFLAPVHPLSGASDPAALASASPSDVPVRKNFAPEAMVLQRDRTGQFHLSARVNGEATQFLVDTGADTVALTTADAERVGIHVDPASFQPILRTASGEGWGTVAQIDRIEIGNAELRNIGAVVVKDLGVSLLGQSALARLGKVELRGDTMVLEPAN